MNRIGSVLLVIFGCFLSIHADLVKVKDCNGYLDYQPVNDKREDELQFYMQMTAKTEQECIQMCYEKLHFCYTVMYKQRSDRPGTDGVCFFGYYRPDACDGPSNRASGDAQTQSNSNAEHAVKQNNVNAKIYTCITCKENAPSFVQEVEDNRVGPARLIRPVSNSHTKPSHSSSVTPNQTTDALPNHILLLRESKAFSYLMPKCTGTLRYGVQATLMNTRPKVYAATNETTSVQECAHFCYRQHFCASSFYHNDNCLLSYEASQCSHVSSLPVGYTGAVAISCIECQKDGIF